MKQIKTLSHRFICFQILYFSRCHETIHPLPLSVCFVVCTIFKAHTDQIWIQQIWTPSKWTPRSKSASEYEPGSPYPLANMDLWGSLFASGFGLPSRIWTPRVFYHCNVSYFEYCTESVLNRHKSHLIYFKNRTKIFRSSNLRPFRLKNSVKVYEL